MPTTSLLQRLGDTSFYNTGKLARDSQPSYSLRGVLFRKQGSMGEWLMLSVPNALVRGTFDAMSEPGIELPTSGNGQLTAHVTVMNPDELKQAGGAEAITERGHSFSYRLGGLETVEPHGWPEMSRVWMLRVFSPELQSLRRSYGLSSLPRDGQQDFHITVARRRKSVLGRNDVSKNQEAVAN